ncbi:MAG TPA: hypothetical protein VK817_17765 [Trebonia sp.]|jgi:hypothetical protein|nr:hypothetical protein [Trebonia sp.]
MGTPFFQSPDPAGAPDPVTPADGPSDPAGWAQVTPSATEPAPYSISGPQDIAGIGAALAAAMDLSGGAEGAGPGAGIPDRHSPRQAEAEAILMSPQGAGAMNVTSGFPDYESSDISPGANMENPVQGAGTYPGTRQDDVQVFDDGLGSGVTGVPPEGGSMDSPVTGYPGTTQSGLTKYGTS